LENAFWKHIGGSSSKSPATKVYVDSLIKNLSESQKATDSQKAAEKKSVKEGNTPSES